MSKQTNSGAARLRTIVLVLGVFVCLASMGYGLLSLQAEVSTGRDLRELANELRQLSGQVVASARRSELGEASTFSDLEGQVVAFDENLSLLQTAGLYEPLSLVDVAWQPVKRAANSLLDSAPLVVFIQDVATRYRQDSVPMQRELTAVVDRLAERNTSAATQRAAQTTLWLSERIGRNIDGLVPGKAATDASAQAIRADAEQFIGLVEALTRGDARLGISRVTDASAIEALSRAFSQFSIVSTAAERIAGSAAELDQAIAARDTLLASGPALGDAIAALDPAISALASASAGGHEMLLGFIVAPSLLAVGLLLVLCLDQRRRALLTGRGVAGINAALQQIAEGDLTALAPEDHRLTAGIARQVNAATGQQRQIVHAIHKPFEASLRAIASIGKSAASQVQKGVELTAAVKDSREAATKMVRASEQIKASTAQAATTSSRNCEQVAQGYELTKDMSEASADVRESVQETSKSAKRQSELIQSVTAAAEYIQALNTKISVVAINTRIEAEKAGEYGRPFLGIAEAIADLLREAGEEGRKIISEVRTLQNMSAENLASMETTVGTVVTILEYIERLDTSLEEINSGSKAISSIVRSVDDAAGVATRNAQHMNSSMTKISKQNLEINQLSEATQAGVHSLEEAMQAAQEQLGRFTLGDAAASPEAELLDPDGLDHIRAAAKTYREADMSALELAQPVQATV